MTFRFDRSATIALISLLTILLGGALGASPSAAEDGKPGVVNINQATEDQLTLLPRVGPALAERIVAFRESNGAFQQAEDLILVRGIGEKTFALMEAHVVVEGETTLTEKVRTSASSRGTDDRR